MMVQQYFLRGIKALSFVEVLCYTAALLAIACGVVFAQSLMVKVYLLIALGILPVFLILRGFVDELDEISELFDVAAKLMKTEKC